jgi:hypothetical protein
MPDNYWDTAHAELRDLVEHLRPDDALEIIKKLVRSPEENMAPMLSGLIRGYVQRRDDEQRTIDMA